MVVWANDSKTRFFWTSNKPFITLVIRLLLSSFMLVHLKSLRLNGHTMWLHPLIQTLEHPVQHNGQHHREGTQTRIRVFCVSSIASNYLLLLFYIWVFVKNKGKFISVRKRLYKDLCIKKALSISYTVHKEVNCLIIVEMWLWVKLYRPFEMPRAKNYIASFMRSVFSMRKEIKKNIQITGKILMLTL